MITGRSDASWADLKPTYRARLQRAGITRDAYIAGVPLRAARGQANAEPRRLTTRKQTRTAEKAATGVTTETLERRRRRFFGKLYIPPSKRKAGVSTKTHSELEANWEKLVDMNLTPRQFSKIMNKTDVRRMTPNRHRRAGDIVIDEETDNLFWYHIA